MSSEQTQITFPLKERLMLLRVYMSTTEKYFLNETDAWKFLQEYICFIEKEYCDPCNETAIEVTELSHWHRCKDYFYFFTPQRLEKKICFIINVNGAFAFIDLPHMCHFAFSDVSQAEFIYNHPNKDGLTIGAR